MAFFVCFKFACNRSCIVYTSVFDKYCGFCDYTGFSWFWQRIFKTSSAKLRKVLWETKPGVCYCRCRNIFGLIQFQRISFFFRLLVFSRTWHDITWHDMSITLQNLLPMLTSNPSNSSSPAPDHKTHSKDGIGTHIRHKFHPRLPNIWIAYIFCQVVVSETGCEMWKHPNLASHAASHCECDRLNSKQPKHSPHVLRAFYKILKNASKFVSWIAITLVHKSLDCKSTSWSVLEVRIL